MFSTGIEFDEHRHRFSYPAEVVVNAEIAVAEVVRAIAARTLPFDNSHLGMGGLADR